MRTLLALLLTGCALAQSNLTTPVHVLPKADHSAAGVLTIRKSDNSGDLYTLDGTGIHLTDAALKLTAGDASGRRMEIRSTGVVAYDPSNVEHVFIDPDNGNIRSDGCLALNALGGSTSGNAVFFCPAATIASTVTWTLPSADSAGCFQSDGAGLMTIASCGGSGGGVAGLTTQIQYNDSGAFGASADLTWNNSLKTLSSLVFNSTQPAGTSAAFTLANANFVVDGNGFLNTKTVQGGSGTTGTTTAIRNLGGSFIVQNDGTVLSPTFSANGGSNVVTMSNGLGFYATDGVQAATARADGTILSTLLAGSGTRCVQADNTGKLGLFSAGCSTLTIPGANTQVIYNNSGALGASANFTWNNGTSTLAAVTVQSTQVAGTSAAFSLQNANFVVDGNGFLNTKTVQGGSGTTGTTTAIRNLGGSFIVQNDGTALSPVFSANGGSNVVTVSNGLGHYATNGVNAASIAPSGIIFSSLLSGSGTRCVQANNSGQLGLSATDCIPNTRTISTTSPLTGGGDLSANRTLACANCDDITATQTVSGQKTFSNTNNQLTGSLFVTGNFYLRPLSSNLINCAGIADGWFAANTGGQELLLCAGGNRYKVALTAY